MGNRPISILPGYNPAIIAKRKARTLSNNEARNHRIQSIARLEYEARNGAREHGIQQRQRLQDMCEDAGLVFVLKSLNPYSAE